MLKVGIDATGARAGASQFATEAERVTGAARSATTAIRDMFAVFVVGGIAYKAIDAIKDFEYAMAQLKGVSQASVAQMNAFEKAARDLGKTTKFSATDAAEALLHFSKAGFSVSEAIAATPAALSLATAHTLDLGFATETTANAMRQFGLDASETTRIVDALSITANLSTIDVRDLAGSLKFVGGVASSAGIQIEEVNAAIGVLGNNAIKGFLAGTNLRGIFSKLLDPTPSLAIQDALDGLKLTMDDLDPRTQTLASLFRKLRDAGMDVSSAVQLFGRSGANAALKLAESADLIETYAQAQRDGVGATKALADTMNDTIVGSFAHFSAAVKELAISVGDSGLASSMRSFTDVSSDVILALAGSETGFVGSKEAAQEYARTLTALGAGAITGILLPALRAAGAAVLTFTAELMTNPFGLALVAISSTVAALVYFKDSTIEVGGRVMALGDLVGGVWSGIWDNIKTVGSAIMIVFEDLIESWRKMLGIMPGETKTVFESLASFFSGLLTNVAGAFKGTINLILNSLEWVTRGVVQLLKRLQEVASSIAAFSTSGNVGFLGNAANSASSIVGDQIDLFKETMYKDRLGDLWKRAQKRAGVMSFNTPKDWWNDMLIRGQANYDERQSQAASKASMDAFDIESYRTQQNRSGVSRRSDSIIPDVDPAEFGRVKRGMNEMIAALQDEREQIGKTSDQIEQMKVARKGEAFILENRMKDGSAFLMQLQDELRLTQASRLSNWFSDKIKGMNAESAALGQTSNQTARATAYEEAYTKALEANTQEAWDSLRVFELSQQAYADDAAGSWLKDRIKSITDETRLIGLNTQEREMAIAVREAEAAAIDLGTTKMAEMVEATKAALLAQHQAQGAAWFEERFKAIADENSLIGLGNEQRDLEVQLREASAVAMDHQMENADDYLESLREELRIGMQLRGMKWQEDNLKSLREERDLIYMTNEQRELAVKLQEAKKNAEDHGLQFGETETAAYTVLIEQMQRMRELKNLADAVGVSFSQALGDLIVSGKDANDVLKDLALTVYKLVFDQTVGAPLAKLLSSGITSLFGSMVAAENGTVISGGAIQPFARGGAMYTSPTMIPMANGNTALVAEHGPGEAVFPLKRMGDGRLGISAEGGRGSGGGITVNMTVVTKDADSFKRSKSQISSEISRGISQARQNS